MSEQPKELSDMTGLELRQHTKKLWKRKNELASQGLKETTAQRQERLRAQTAEVKRKYG